MLRIETSDLDTDQGIISYLADYLVAITGDDGTEHGDFFLDCGEYVTEHGFCYLAWPAVETDDGEWVRKPEADGGELIPFPTDSVTILIY